MTDTGFDYDLFVIGGGSGGVRAARIAALAGAKVALAEEYRMGGTCVIRGCVPKKFMVYASDYAKKIKEAAGFGWTIERARYDHSAFRRGLDAEISRLSAIYERNLRAAGADIFAERAVFADAQTVQLLSSGRKIRARKILIATGGRPWRPSPDELPGVVHTITSDDVFHLPDIPKRIIVAGGGYIAVEFAHVFAGLGADTTLVYRGEKVLRGFDEDVRLAVHDGLTAAGVNVITQTVFSRISLAADGTHEVLLTNGARLEADTVLMAVGRRPNTDGLGCEAAGIKLSSDGAVIVDHASRTSAPSVWAVGDVTDKVALTPVAIREGHAFADTEFGGRPWAMDYDCIPTAVFAQPEVGTVGMTEAAARAAYGAVDIYKTQFRPMKNMLTGDPARTLMKLVVRRADERVLGVHIVGPDAAEIIQAVAIAVKMGATKPDLDRTCALHPSAAEELVTLRTKWTG